MADGRRAARGGFAAQPPDPGPEEPDWFAVRVAAQQNANDLGPVFAAFARSCADGVTLEGTLPEAAEAVAELAREVAAAVTGQEQIGAREMAPFRKIAAEFVAKAWKENGLSGYDPRAVAFDIATCFRLHPRDGSEGFPALSGGASLALTSASVALVLMRPVMTYDFRRDPGTLLAVMRNAVLDAATEAASAVLPKHASLDDRRTVLQTYSNRYADLMASSYERHARRAVAHLVTLAEPEREAWCAAYDPMPDVLQTFGSWGMHFAAINLAFANRAAGPAGAKPSPGPR